MRGIAFVLMEDVKNPKPDRRSKDWTAQQVWKKGDVFYIRQLDHGAVRVDKGGFGSVHNIYDCPDKLRCEALLKQLGPLGDSELTVNRVIHELDAGHEGPVATQILEGLVKAGKISFEDMRQAWLAEEEAFNKQYEADKAEAAKAAGEES